VQGYLTSSKFIEQSHTIPRFKLQELNKNFSNDFSKLGKEGRRCLSRIKQDKVEKKLKLRLKVKNKSQSAFIRMQLSTA
jgi:hypothetical protein